MSGAHHVEQDGLDLDARLLNRLGIEGAGLTAGSSACLARWLAIRNISFVGPFAGSDRDVVPPMMWSARPCSEGLLAA
jgi:hypothetical protein